MDEKKYGVHTSHCCAKHGCKYGEPDCPVVNNVVKQEYLCEYCRDEGIEDIEELISEEDIEKLKLIFYDFESATGLDSKDLLKKILKLVKNEYDCFRKQEETE